LTNTGDNSAPVTAKTRRVLSVRRFALLTTCVAGLGAAALVLGPGLNFTQGYTTAHAQNLSEQAKKLQAPVGFADIVAKVKPAVISVRVKLNGHVATTGLGNNQLPPGLREFFFHQFGGMRGFHENTPKGHNQVRRQEGSGFFISADGYAVTNNHVVANAESVEVKTDDGKTHKAKVIGTDPRTDLALIKVDGSGYPYVKLADKQPRIGDWVLAVGNPYGLGGTVTAGILSARNREVGNNIDEMLQIDAPINKGNSGGPTFDIDGNVIGVNTAIVSPSGGSVGIAFAIPADTVKSVVSQLKAHGMVAHGWLGIQIQPITKDVADSLGLKQARGALVAQPQPNSPAAKAGIKARDAILAVNGKPVKDAHDLAEMIGSMAPGTEVKLSVVRDSAKRMISVKLGTFPKKLEARLDTSPKKSEQSDGKVKLGKFGLTLAPAKKVAGAGDKGVVVTGVDSSGVAASQGFSTGDVILDVAGKSVSTPEQVRNEIASVRSQGKRAVLVRVKSGSNTHFVALPIKRG
jgi:serine protease Do